MFSSDRQKNITLIIVTALLLIGAFYLFGENGEPSAEHNAEFLALTCDAGPDQMIARLKNSGDLSLQLDQAHMLIYESSGELNRTLTRSPISLEEGSPDIVRTRNSPDISSPGDITEYIVNAGGTIVPGRDYTVDIILRNHGITISQTCTGE